MVSPLSSLETPSPKCEICVMCVYGCTTLFTSYYGNYRYWATRNVRPHDRGGLWPCGTKAIFCPHGGLSVQAWP